MQTKNKFLFIILFIFTLSIITTADDGMWMPHQMKGLNLQKKGLKMNPDDLYKKDGTGLMSAVVYLGGATGEFVSKEGLILTNHHVAFGAIQRASDIKNDYIKNGFLAKSKSLEIPAKGYIADVLIEYSDITYKFNKVLNSKKASLKKFKQIEKIKKSIIRREEKKAKDLRCSVKSMYSGNKFYLFKFKRLRDVRLVFAPPRSLGNFGGDIDNWMWPRHTCDFTYLRAYVSKNNVGTAYNKGNIPYKPKAVFKISLDGIKKGDFSFIMGYPGRTYRNYTYSQFMESFSKMEEKINQYKDIIQFFEKAGKGDRGIQIKYASIIKGLNNGMKNRRGKLEGFHKQNVAEKKLNIEKELIAWIQKDKNRVQKYGKAIKKIDAFIKINSKKDKENELINSLVNGYMGPQLLSQAYRICRTSIENQKSDKKRETGYQKRDLPYIRQRIKLAERNYELNTEKKYFKYLLKKAKSKKGYRLTKTLQKIFSDDKNGIDSFVDAAYSKTILSNPEKRLKLLSYSPKQLLKLNDPIINLAFEFESFLKDIRKQGKTLKQELNDLKKLYIAAKLEKVNGNLAPDANSSIRFTYGQINGYSPRDAVKYTFQTSLKGVIEKNTGKAPFNVPEKLKELYMKKDFGRYSDPETKDIPTCFLNETNVTGGNSGSPVLNAKGEQTGIIFDMTYESVTGDYFVIPEMQRTISVDIRYVLFITEKFSGASNLIKELGL